MLNAEKTILNPLFNPSVHPPFLFFLLIQLHLEFTTHFNWFFSACQSRWWCWPFNWIVNSNCDILSCNIFHFCCIKPLHSIPIWKFDLSFSFWKIFLGNFLRLSILIFFVNNFFFRCSFFVGSPSGLPLFDQLRSAFLFHYNINMTICVRWWRRGCCKSSVLHFFDPTLHPTRLFIRP